MLSLISRSVMLMSRSAAVMSLVRLITVSLQMSSTNVQVVLDVLLHLLGLAFEVLLVSVHLSVPLLHHALGISNFVIAFLGAEHSHLAGRVGGESVLNRHLINCDVVPQSILAAVAFLEVSLDGLSHEVHLGSINEGSGSNGHEHPVSVFLHSTAVVTDNTGVLVTEVVSSISIVLVDGTSLNGKDSISVSLHLEVDTAGAPADAAGDEAKNRNDKVQGHEEASVVLLVDDSTDRKDHLMDGFLEGLRAGIVLRVGDRIREINGHSLVVGEQGRVLVVLVEMRVHEHVGSSVKFLVAGDVVVALGVTELKLADLHEVHDEHNDTTQDSAEGADSHGPGKARSRAANTLKVNALVARVLVSHLNLNYEENIITLILFYSNKL